MIVRPLVALTAALLAILPAPPAHASAGDLDTRFGHDGKVQTDFSGPYDIAAGMAVLPDERVIVAGFTEWRIALSRYGHRGLDRTFGRHGRVIVDFGTDVARAHDVVVQPDQRFVVVGGAGPFSDSDFALARFLPNGSLDTSFGKDGRVVMDLGGYEVMVAAALQPDGGIVAVGSAQSNGVYDFAVTRFNPDGSPDDTFAGDGAVILSLSSIHDHAIAVVIQPDGRIVAGGTAQVNGGERAAMVRFNPDGSLDQSFGDGGIVISDLGPYREGVYAMALQADGKIVVTGLFSKPARLVARYNPDGSLDQSFGSGGLAIIEFPFVEGRDIAIQGDGKIITVGRAEDITQGFGISRQNPDGSFDDSFGEDGLVSTRFGSYAEAESVALLRHGLILAAGFSPIDQDERFVLARYLG